MSHPEKPAPAERQPAALTGRDSAPTGAPMGASAPMGGEGSPSAQVEARRAGVQFGQVLKWLLAPLLYLWHYTPTICLRTIPTWSGWWVSVHIDKEGVFLSFRPFELAILRPGIEI